MKTYIVVFDVDAFPNGAGIAGSLNGKTFMNINTVVQEYPGCRYHEIGEWVNMYNNLDADEDGTFISYVYTE